MTVPTDGAWAVDWSFLEVLEENLGPRWSTVSENVQGTRVIRVQRNM